MKRILLSLGLVAAIAPAMTAETYDYPTTPLPSGAVWTPATAAPGVYSELSGRYQLDLQNVWYQLEYKDQFPVAPSQNPICGWVVNEDNEIVFAGTTRLTGTGMRNGLQMYLDITTAVTEPGTYYIIFPTGKTKSEPNGVFETYTQKLDEKIFNIKAGPYIVGEVGEPVEPEITVTPSGVFEQPEGISYVTLTVANANPELFNVGDAETSISVKGPNGAITMEPGVREGNTFKWEFPVDENGENTAKLANGNYTITINFSTFTAFTENLNPIAFPATATYEFSVEGGLIKMTPVCTFSPTTMTFENWTATTIGITLKDAKFKGTVAELKENHPSLIVVDPDGESYTLTTLSARISVAALGYTLNGLIDFSKYGTYNCYWKIGGWEGTRNSDGEAVIFEDIAFAYEHPKPVPVVVPEVTQSSPKQEVEKWSTTTLALKMGYIVDDVASDKYPALEFTAPNGETFEPSQFAYRSSSYTYRVDPTDFAEPGIYTAVWKLGGWTATDNTTKEAVKLSDVTLTYIVGTPEEPEEDTTADTTIQPEPGAHIKKINGIHVAFGQEFLPDFAAWTDEFNAVATITNLTDNSEITVEPILSEGGTLVIYDVQLKASDITSYRVAINLWKQKYYVAATARALETAYVPADKAWIVTEYTLDRDVLVEEIGAESEVYFLDLNGNRLPSAPEKGVYIRVSNAKAAKEVK